MAKYGTWWRTPANSHLSWRPEWLSVQHTWLTLLEPGHCPLLVPTLTTIAGRCVGAGCPPCPATSETRHYGHPTRLTGPGSGLPPSHTPQGGQRQQRERGGESRAAQGRSEPGACTPSPPGDPGSQEDATWKPSLPYRARPDTPQSAEHFWASFEQFSVRRCQRSLHSFSWGSSHHNADVNLEVLCGTQVTSQYGCFPETR